ncbi:Glutathione-dependent formaldehyde-activating enzyme [Rhodobacteraceae bacterium THAF1]|uniref:GFA family protein n=1 Tax=Palleronia sp. THAF1 TaxID=2587842 RepID=UPI000F4192E2|nr:GFA family protein [Palleronia sp. THAF1]QFU09033.1 Glutathione-dependent formaldehyde-activating enzyme [Palleronia sp. THAF1]VDC24202.1 Glutathione-dependent formaldehyde-activating enzyme [Rhodobacteraceae bacterium THAF1]
MRVRATCHCGAIELMATLVDGLNTIRRCDCSYCSRRQAAPVSASACDIEVTKGADVLALYQWGTRTAEHHFCSICGIYTHHRRRSNPNEYGVNAACIDGVDVRTLEPIPWNDGVNHPSDT